MWRVTVNCSAESWRISATAFNAILAKYPATPIGSKKFRDDERREMDFQLDDVNDAESFQEECMTLDGFTAQFESL